MIPVGFSQQDFINLQRERLLMSGQCAPETVADFDRLVLESPDSSLIWLRYMAFHLETAEIEKARAVAERALKTISFRFVSLPEVTLGNCLTNHKFLFLLLKSMISSEYCATGIIPSSSFCLFSRQLNTTYCTAEISRPKLLLLAVA